MFRSSKHLNVKLPKRSKILYFLLQLFPVQRSLFRIFRVHSFLSVMFRSLSPFSSPMQSIRRLFGLPLDLHVHRTPYIVTLNSPQHIPITVQSSSKPPPPSPCCIILHYVPSCFSHHPNLCRMHLL